MEKNDIKITENLKRMIINEHPYAISKGADGRWRTYVKEGEVEQGRRMIVKARRKDLLDAIASYYVLSGNEQYLKKCVSIRTLFPEWLEYKALHTNADIYIKRIMTEWARYYENDPIVDRPIYLLKKIELDKWAHRKIKKYDMTKNMYYNFAVIIRQCLQYAVDMEIVGNNEYERVYIDGRRMFRKKGKKSDMTQVYTRNEVKALFGAAWNDF